MTRVVEVSGAVVEGTLEALREAGTRGCERLVLWLGLRTASSVLVDQAYTPPQHTARDFFEVPGDVILDLCQRVGSSGRMVAAQVHSHPGRAFHSAADDRWALVRHVGALSFVVPRFAMDTAVDNFLSNVAVYQLSAENEWRGVIACQLPHLVVLR